MWWPNLTNKNIKVFLGMEVNSYAHQCYVMVNLSWLINIYMAKVKSGALDFIIIV